MLAIGTPGQAPEEGVGVVAVPDDLGTAPGGRLPEPDGMVPAATGQRASIWAPGHGLHLLRMPHQRLAQAKAACLSQLPELDAAIPARAGQGAAVGSKGQSPHPATMAYEALDAGRWAARPDLPQPDRARIVASGEQVPIRTPGQSRDLAGMRHFLQEGTQLRIPEPDCRIKSSTCQ